MLCAVAGIGSCAVATDVSVLTPTPHGDALARVGPYPVELSDLKQAMTAIFGDGSRLEEHPLEDLRTAMDALIAARVLVIEAERRGLDQEAETAVDSLKFVLLRDAIYDQEVYRDLPVPTETEIAQLYQDWGRGSLVNGAHILVRSQQQAEELIQRLDEGASFEQLARSESQHTGSSGQGGSMGFLRRNQYPSGIAEVIWDLPTGAHTSSPFRTSMGWHVLKLIDRRTVTQQAQRPALVFEMERRIRSNAQKRFFQHLRKSYGLTYHPQTAVAVASLRDSLSGDLPLFTWKDGHLLLADFLRRVQVPDPVSEDTARMHRLAGELVFDELAAREAEIAGFLSQDDIRKRLRDKKFHLLSQSVFESETKAAPKLEIARAYHDANRDQFRGHIVLTIREILVDELSLADSLYQLVAGGGDLVALAGTHTVRTDLSKSGGLWEDVNPQDPRGGRIYKAALKAGPGLHAPMKVPGGYSFFDVLEIRPGRILQFEEAEAGIRIRLEAAHMEALIGRLRETADISVDWERLEALAAGSR
jgi:peptidyl-prolyl cis-trans isomerase C